MRQVGQGLLYLIASIEPDAHKRPAYEEACQTYQCIAEVLTDSGAEVVQERLFGLLDAREEVLRGRRDGLGDVVGEELPCTYVEGAPLRGGSLAGVQILAVQPGGEPETEITTLRSQGRVVGRALERFGTRFIYLSDISADAQQEASAPSDPEVDAREMFYAAQRLLQELGASYLDVVRTWIYLSDILSWYDQFNRVRNRVYQELGIPDDRLPASTGIEGDNPLGTSCIMDLMAVQSQGPDAVHITALSNPIQNEAYHYGSAFSRGVRVEEADVISLYASGCASIDEQGRTLFAGDARKQIARTLLNVEALLEEGDLSPEDICKATVFLKRGVDPEVFHEVRRAVGYPDLPAVYVFADICRDDLLFEIDASAARSKLVKEMNR